MAQDVDEPGKLAIEQIEQVVEVAKEKEIQQISHISQIKNGENWLILRYKMLLGSSFMYVCAHFCAS
jgi:hypothetical protein